MVLQNIIQAAHVDCRNHNLIHPDLKLISSQVGGVVIHHRHVEKEDMAVIVIVTERETSTEAEILDLMQLLPVKMHVQVLLNALQVQRPVCDLKATMMNSQAGGEDNKTVNIPSVNDLHTVPE